MIPALHNQIVLVTGGARGLGAALCEALCNAGAKVAVADLRIEQANELADHLCQRGFEAFPIALDVGRDADASVCVEAVLDRYGRIDVLINNAGVDYTLPIDELSVDQWDRVIATNLRGPFLLSKHVVPAMKKRGTGHIVNICSTAAKRAWPNASAYHASKWGLLGLSHALHVEARPLGVKVTAVISGGMRTPFLLERFPDIDVQTLQEPRTVAETVRFVLSQPAESVIPEVMVLPMRETSWP